MRFDQKWLFVDRQRCVTLRTTQGLEYFRISFRKDEKHPKYTRGQRHNCSVTDKVWLSVCNTTHGFLVWSYKFTGMHYCHLNSNILPTEVLHKECPSSSILHKMVNYLNILTVLFSTRSRLAQSSRQTRRISLGDYTVWFNNKS